MSRAAIYRRQWYADNGHLLELQVIPASDEPLPIPRVYVTIPDDAVDVDSLSELVTKYDKIPIGNPETPTLDITWDFSGLDASAPLQDLRGYLLDPIQPGAGELTIDGETRTIDTTNVMILLSDMGDGAAPDTVLFIGAQRAKDEEDIEIDEETEVETYTATVAHLTREVLERIPPEFITQYLIGGNPFGTADISGIIQYIYRDGDSIARFRITRQMKDGDTETARGISLAGLYGAIENVAEQVTQLLLRASSSTFTLASAANGNGATPYDHWVGYRQDHTQDNLPGNSFLWRDLKFPARTYKPSAPTVNIGGFLVQPSEGSSAHTLYSYTDMWHFMSTSIEAALAKGQLLSTADGVTLHMAMVDETASTHDLKLTDIVKGKRKISPRMNRIDDTAVTLKVGSDESQPGRIAADGSVSSMQNARGHNIAVVFHNHPKLGPLGSEYEWANDFTGDPSGEPGAMPDITGPAMGTCVPGFQFDELYYEAYDGDGHVPAGLFDASGVTAANPVGIRPHNQVTIYKSSTESFTGGADLAYPTEPYLFSGGHITNFSEGNRTAIRAALLAMQKTACVGFMTGKLCSLWFGSALQYGLKDITVDIEHHQLAWLGEIYQLVAAGVPVGPNLFLRGRTYLGNYAAAMIALESKVSPTKGKSTITFLGLG